MILVMCDLNYDLVLIRPRVIDLNDADYHQ